MIAPGVFGVTGIETEEVITSVSKRIEADLVVLIDSLCGAGAPQNRYQRTDQRYRNYPRIGRWKQAHSAEQPDAGCRCDSNRRADGHVCDDNCQRRLRFRAP